MHPLDDPALTALTTRHRGLAEAEGGALRYPPSIIPFAALARPDAAGALGRLVQPGEMAALMRSAPAEVPPGFEEVLQGPAVQMLADGPVAAVDDPRISELGLPDAAEMLDLATLTQPGPFTLRALDLGRFWGIRQDGRLVAMAGMRMAVPGLVELSGVCAHPDARGQGLARLLSRYVSARIEEGGDRPFLHAWAANTGAIALYRSIGFSIRTQMHVLAIRRLGTPPGPPGDAGEGRVH